MTDTVAPESAKTEEKKPTLTAFGQQVLSVVASLVAKGEAATVAAISEFTGKAQNIILKSSGKLIKDGYLTVEGEGEAAVYSLTESGSAVTTEVQPAEPKKRETDRRYILKSKPEKGPLQMIGILNALESLGGEAAHDDLMNKIQETIVTRQPAGRVFQFYKKRMETEGHLETV